VGTVVIRCPKTGKVVPVGFAGLRDTFHAGENAMSTVRCLVCGRASPLAKVRTRGLNRSSKRTAVNAPRRLSTKTYSVFDLE
jgi:hypothetical protein